MHAKDVEDKQDFRFAKIDRRSVVIGAVAAPFLLRRANAAEAVRAYSIWPENYARPMLEAFEKATGIHVNFVRFSSGEALARLIAEKGNPQVDVLFGGPVETFTAGEEQGIFEAYTPPSAADLPKRFKSAQGMWTAIADDPLVFMTNTKFLQEHNLKPPASWEDLLDPAYKGQLQMADARTSGTAVTRIFSILQVNNRNEDAGFRVHEEAPAEHSGLHQEWWWRHCAGWSWTSGRWHFLHRRCIVHAAEGLRCTNILPQGGYRFSGRVYRARQRQQEHV